MYRIQIVRAEAQTIRLVPNGIFSEDGILKNICLLICALLFLTVAGCKDDSIPTVTGGERVEFPHQVGSLWTYEYAKTEITGTDTTLVATDTVDVIVIRDTIMANGDSATIWVFRYSSQAKIDTQLVVMADDTILLGWDTLSTPTAIILPLDTSLTWVGGVGLTDTTTVSGPVRFSVRAGSFAETYRVQREWKGFEEGEKTDLWLVPNVGIVWYTFHLQAPMLQPSEIFMRWELLSYDLP